MGSYDYSLESQEKTVVKYHSGDLESDSDLGGSREKRHSPASIRVVCELIEQYRQSTQ